MIGGIDHSLGPGENDPRASEKGRRGSPTSRMTVAVRLLDDHKRMPDVHRVDVIAGLRGHRGDRRSVAGRSPYLLEVTRFDCVRFPRWLYATT